MKVLAAVARGVLPYVASFAIDTSMRVANAKAKTELGRRPTFPTYHDGLRAMVGGPTLRRHPSSATGPAEQVL